MQNIVNNDVVIEVKNEVAKVESKVITHEFAKNYESMKLLCNDIELTTVHDIKAALRLHLSISINKKYGNTIRNSDGEPLKAQICKKYGDKLVSLRVKLDEPRTENGLIIENKETYYNRIKNEATKAYQNALIGFIGNTVEFE